TNPVAVTSNAVGPAPGGGAIVTAPNRGMPGVPQGRGGYPFGYYHMDNTFPGGMLPAGVVPYYVPGYYPAPMTAPMVWGW
ncbi:MAG: hypothetical protein KDA84_07015, partial [Planctomycetaceae bacterium]|nr:hypothetical protein [Planctomycetaceae bacterium]